MSQDRRTVQEDDALELRLERKANVCDTFIQDCLQRIASGIRYRTEPFSHLRIDLCDNGFEQTPLSTEVLVKSEDQVATMAKMIPLGRLAEPDDIAAAGAMLLGPNSHWISGQVIRANGGAV